MSIDVPRSVSTESLSEQVAGEIRAYLGRHRISQAELARRMHVSGPWLNYRLTGKQPIDLNDLEQISIALGVKPTDLFGHRLPTHEQVTIAAQRQAKTRTNPKRSPIAPAHRPPNRTDARRPKLAHA